MLDVFGHTLLIHCQQHQLILQRRSRFGRAIGPQVVRNFDDQVASFEQALLLPQLQQQLRSALTELDCKGASVALVVPDAWCRLFITTPPTNLANRSDWDAAAGLRFQRLYGESAADWMLQADWHVKHPFLTAALPTGLHRDVFDIVRAFKLRVTRFVPECIAAWNRWSRAVMIGDWFAQISQSRLTLIALDGTQICHIVQQPLDIVAMRDPDWLTRFVRREALCLNRPMPQRIACAGAVPAAWLQVNAVADIGAGTELSNAVTTGFGSGTSNDAGNRNSANFDSAIDADIIRLPCIALTQKHRPDAAQRKQSERTERCE